MKQTLLNKLREKETDVDGALERLSGDEALYCSILMSFPLDSTMSRLEAALEARDWDTAFTAAHAMKGLAGNLGITPLFHALGELVIAIRSARLTDIDALFGIAKMYYSEVIRIIEKNK